MGVRHVLVFTGLRGEVSRGLEVRMERLRLRPSTRFQQGALVFNRALVIAKKGPF